MEDFKTVDDVTHRQAIFVKLGSLLIQFSNHGKASFELQIQFIHRDSDELTTFFHFYGERHPAFIFTDLLPFNLDCTATFVQPSASADSSILTHAHRFRSFITQMALGHRPNPHEFQMAILFFLLELHPPRAGSNPTKTETCLDVRDFFDGHFSRIPKHPNEIAAKIACCFFYNFGVSTRPIKSIIKEYLKESQLSLQALNEGWIEHLISLKIDENHYNLNILIPDAVILLHQAIEEIKQEQRCLHTVSL